MMFYLQQIIQTWKYINKFKNLDNQNTPKLNTYKKCYVLTLVIKNTCYLHSLWLMYIHPYVKKLLKILNLILFNN